MPIYRLNDSIRFPSPDLAEHDGLLAVGGDLRPERLMSAYAHGIFPWYSDDQPILWWSPNPRMVLPPAEVHVSRTLRATLRKGAFTFTIDRAFADVVAACAGAERRGQRGTWLTPDMREAYIELHRLGHAHSVEAWREGELAGGLYGVAIGRLFSGESMFSRASDASKAALVVLCAHLCQWGYELIDCQMHTPHLARMGGRDIPRHKYIMLIEKLVRQRPSPEAWRLQP